MIISVWELFFEPLCNGAQVRASLLESDSRLHSSDGAPTVIATPAEIVQRHIERNPKIRCGGNAVPSRQHADDCVSCGVELESLAKSIGAPAKMRLPEGVTEQRNAVRALGVFSGGECAANERRDTKQLEKISLGGNHRNCFGRIRPARVRSARPGIKTHVGEGRVLRAPVEIVFSGEWIVSWRSFGLAQFDELFGMSERKGLQQGRMDDGENGGVRANSKGKCENRN